MSSFTPAETLRQHRPVLLACEAIGWFHMAGKACMEFLRKHGGEKTVDYDYERWHERETPPFDWDAILGWVRSFGGSRIPQNAQNAWPPSVGKFIEDHRGDDQGMLGLLQAGHGMASGIEKNLPNHTSQYLSQALPHMWLSSPFGHPRRNLFADPPEVLQQDGWRRLVEEIRRVLEELRPGPNGAIGRSGRAALSGRPFSRPWQKPGCRITTSRCGTSRMWRPRCSKVQWPVRSWIRGSPGVSESNK